MNCAFLSTLVPESLFEIVESNTRRSMPAAATALELHIHEGLCKNLKNHIPIFNILPISSFPQYYKKCFINESFFSANGYDLQKNIGFCNLKGLKNKSISREVFKHLYKWCCENSGEKILFVYTISAPFMSACSRLKSKFKDLRICAIIADLPNMSSLEKNNSVVKKISSHFLSCWAYSLQNCVDFYVLLTKQMANYMCIQKPYCVMEGIATEFPEVENKNRNSNNNKTILYAGTLHERFGVKNLVDAFTLIPHKDFQLMICGVGDSEKYIENKSKNDKRIVFLGRQPRKKVLELIQSASVLVNPRQNNEEFTKYSFPSKNLEYLSSGIPFVAYKLDGIPDEYDDYVNYVKNNSLESLKETLIDVTLDINGEYKRKSEKALLFVMQYKSVIPQTKKIIDLVTKK